MCFTGLGQPIYAEFVYGWNSTRNSKKGYRNAAVPFRRCLPNQLLNIDGIWFTHWWLEQRTLRLINPGIIHSPQCGLADWRKSRIAFQCFSLWTFPNYVVATTCFQIPRHYANGIAELTPTTVRLILINFKNTIFLWESRWKFLFNNILKDVVFGANMFKLINSLNRTHFARASSNLTDVVIGSYTRNQLKPIAH